MVNKKEHPPPNKGFWSRYKGLIYLAILLTGLTVYNHDANQEVDGEVKGEDVSYNVFLSTLSDYALESQYDLTLVESYSGELKLKVEQEDQIALYQTQISPNGEGSQELLSSYDVAYEYEEASVPPSAIFSLVFYGLLIVLVAFLLINIMKNMGGKKPERLDSKDVPKVTFQDIGGLPEEVMSEITQAKRLLERPADAKELGISPPKGILLHGPSGTGKTLIAKAIANSYGASFYAAEGSGFVEKFVGVGAKNVRNIFAEARKNAPSVIFIDEIDAVAKSRENAGHTNEERLQTLDQLLVEMDGLQGRKDVFVVAATNQFESLDKAILRPGRFDFKIHVSLPDKEGRKDIISIHASKTKMDEELTSRLSEVADWTPGYSGAELEHLIQSAAIYAFRDKRKEISVSDVQKANDRLIIGSVGRSIQDEKVKERIAYHEAGHALLQALQNPGSVRKTTIIPRGGALGYMAPVLKEISIETQSELNQRLKTLVAGAVSEHLIYGDHSNGVANDFMVTKQIIEKMIKEWGMGMDALFPSYDEKKGQQLMEEYYEWILDECWSILQTHRKELDEIAALLIEKETIDGKEVDNILQCST